MELLGEDVAAVIADEARWEEQEYEERVRSVCAALAMTPAEWEARARVKPKALNALKMACAGRWITVTDLGAVTTLVTRLCGVAGCSADWLLDGHGPAWVEQIPPVSRGPWR